MTRKVTVTARTNTTIVRRGATVEIDWTPRVGRLIDAGRLIEVKPAAEASTKPSRDDLIAQAEAAGIHVAKSWTKDRITEALAAAQEAETDAPATGGPDAD